MKLENIKNDNSQHYQGCSNLSRNFKKLINFVPELLLLQNQKFMCKAAGCSIFYSSEI